MNSYSLMQLANDGTIRINEGLLIFNGFRGFFPTADRLHFRGFSQPQFRPRIPYSCQLIRLPGDFLLFIGIQVTVRL